MNKKYLVFSGAVVSHSDGDRHWIPSHKVAQLYGLNPEECVFANAKYPEEYLGYRDLIELHPRSDGNYTNEKPKYNGYNLEQMKEYRRRLIEENLTK